jgi:YfiH family protein
MNPFLPQPTDIGSIWSDKRVTLAFGNSDSSLENLQALYPALQFCFLKQVHSSRVVETTSAVVAPLEADAHWTREPGIGLCIRTADCMPILIASQSAPFIAAVHAGWRGVEAEIVAAVFREAVQSGVGVDDLRIWIGPHIGGMSFEVKDDVASPLRAAWEKVSSESFAKVCTASADGEHFLIDLQMLVIAQLQRLGVSPVSIVVSAVDTLTHPNYYSYRRDHEAAGRQISFIALRG